MGGGGGRGERKRGLEKYFKQKWRQKGENGNARKRKPHSYCHIGAVSFYWAGLGVKVFVDVCVVPG